MGAGRRCSRGLAEVVAERLDRVESLLLQYLGVYNYYHNWVLTYNNDSEPYNDLDFAEFNWIGESDGDNFSEPHSNLVSTEFNGASGPRATAFISECWRICTPWTKPCLTCASPAPAWISGALLSDVSTLLSVSPAVVSPARSLCVTTFLPKSTGVCATRVGVHSESLCLPAADDHSSVCHALLVCRTILLPQSFPGANNIYCQ